MQQPEFLTFDCTGLTVDFLTENESLSFCICHQTVRLESSRLSRSGNSSSEAHHVLLITVWIAHLPGKSRYRGNVCTGIDTEAMSLELHIAKEGLCVTHAKAHTHTHTHRGRGSKKARERDTDTDTQRDTHTHTET